METEQMFPKFSSNSPSMKTESQGILCSASKDSGSSGNTLTSSAESRRSVNWDDKSSSSYDADDERRLSGVDSEADESELSDGSRHPSPILNEQCVQIFIGNVNAEKEMGLYNMRRK